MIDYNSIVAIFNELLRRERDKEILTEIENQLNITISNIKKDESVSPQTAVDCYLYLFLTLRFILKPKHYHLLFYGIYTCYHNLNKIGKSLYYLLVLQNYGESLTGEEKDNFYTVKNPINTFISFYKDQVLKTVCDAPGKLRILVVLDSIDELNPILAALYKAGQKYDIVRTIKTYREYIENNKLIDYNIIFLSTKLFDEINNFIAEHAYLIKKYPALGVYFKTEPDKFQMCFSEGKALPGIITANECFIFSSLLIEIERQEEIYIK